MRVITEAELREQFKKEEFTAFHLPSGTRLTPSAHQFLTERRIEIIQEEAGVSGSNAGEKPEHMTHLRGKILVPKNHPVIKFRGKLDSFQSFLLSTIIDVDHAGYRSLARDLSEVLDYARKIMSAEVREKTLEPLQFRGLNQMEIRERSHHPEKFYGTGHILPQPVHGRLIAQLNILRTQVRELEVTGIDTFGEPDKQHADILTALNRLSSLIYVMMLEVTAGHYKIGS